MKEDRLDKNISITSLEPAPKIWDSQVYQRYNVTTLGAKTGRAQYGKCQRGGEDKKGKRDRKDREDKRNGEYHWGNKKHLVVRENSSSEASVYHHIIYKY